MLAHVLNYTLTFHLNCEKLSRKIYYRLILINKIGIMKLHVLLKTIFLFFVDIFGTLFCLEYIFCVLLQYNFFQ